MNLDKMTRIFLMGESKTPSIQSYLQSLKEVLTSIRPRSGVDERRLEMAQNHLREIRRAVRYMESQIATLEDRYSERISETKEE